MLRQYRRDAWIIFGLLAFIYAYFYQDAGFNGNSRFGLIFAVVQEGNLSIDTFHKREGTETGDKAYFNGHYYSDKAIGPSLMGTVFYAPLYGVKLLTGRLSQSAAKVILTFLVIGLPSAFAGSLIYLFCVYISKSRLLAYLVTLAITLGTLYFPYSIVFFSHQFSSSLLFSAFFLIFFLKEMPELWNNWYVFLIGSLLGWVLISEYPAALIILALITYYLFVIWRDRNFHRLRSIALPLLGGLIPVFLHLLYNKLTFDNFFSIGYAHLHDLGFLADMQQGVMGMGFPDLDVVFYTTLHPLMGLFWQSPVLLFSFLGAGVILADRRYRAEALLAVGVIVSYIVLMSGYYMWWGGLAVGPRHIIPVLPFFCILLIFIPRRFTWLFALLLIISVIQMLIVSASDIMVPDDRVMDIRVLGYFDYSNIYNYCLQQLMNGHFATNLGVRILGLQSWISLIPVFLAIGVATRFLFGSSLRNSKNNLLTTT